MADGALARGSSNGESWFLPNVKIPLKAIVEHLVCPICMCVISDCVATVPCGHNFCRGCIKEALNLKHRCPICKTETDMSRLIDNKPFNALVEALTVEKKKAASDYFTHVTADGPAVSPAADGAAPEPEPSAFSSVEQAFRRHHQQALVAYTSVAEDIKRAYAVRRAKSAGAVGAAATDREEAATLEQLSRDYEMFLAHSAKPPSIGVMAVTVHCEVRTENGRTRLSQRLSVTTFLDDLRKLIETSMAEMGDPIVTFSDDATFTALPPGASTDDLEGCAGVGELPGARVLAGDKPIVLGWKLLTGSTIVIEGRHRGGIKLASEARKECFKLTYAKGVNEVSDFYSCIECAVKWLCPACALGPCHKGKGHTVSIFLKDHTATYAVCYCKKKKLCCLAPKK